MKCPNCGFIIKKKIRSVKHNNFFFGTLIDPLAEHIGENPKETYTALKVRLLSPQPGKLVPDGTSEMSPRELENFIERIVAFAAEFYEFTYDPNGIQELIRHYEG